MSTFSRQSRPTSVRFRANGDVSTPGHPGDLGRWRRKDPPSPAPSRCVRWGRCVPRSGRLADQCDGVLWQSADVSLPRRDVDPDGLLEYSVVFTDRSLNHMSKRFVGVMRDIIDVLCTTYGAEAVAVVPGGGTYAMEAVARQVATGRRCLVVRNGMFSYRCSAIFDAGSIPAEATV